MSHGKKPAGCTKLAFFLSDPPFPSEPALDSEMTSKLKSHEFRGSRFQVTRGDYAPILHKVVEHLEKAKVGLAGVEVCGL